MSKLADREAATARAEAGGLVWVHSVDGTQYAGRGRYFAAVWPVIETGPGQAWRAAVYDVATTERPGSPVCCWTFGRPFTDPVDARRSVVAALLRCELLGERSTGLLNAAGWHWEVDHWHDRLTLVGDFMATPRVYCEGEIVFDDQVGQVVRSVVLRIRKQPAGPLLYYNATTACRNVTEARRWCEERARLAIERGNL